MGKSTEGLGARIKRLRRELDWTQQQLAGEAGIDQTVISKLENRADYEPSVFLAARVAKALRVSLDELVNGDERTKPQASAVEAGSRLPEDLGLALQALRLEVSAAMQVAEKARATADEAKSLAQRRRPKTA